MPPSEHDEVARFAELLAALGAKPRLLIVRLLLDAHPRGLAAGEIATRLEITPATLSHHLDRLKREEIVAVRRERTFLWYTANTGTLQSLTRFLRTLTDERTSEPPRYTH